ncbi:MAG: flagellar hook-basal body complex protein [Xanthomonadaceae bacterium]|nr:flagellar hook-basal body complex protein [Xanthomonadaceae bacterium]
MIRALWTAATGMQSQQVNMDVIANNLANVNSSGFKKSRADFQDILYQTSRAAGTGVDGGEVPTGVQVGLGSRVAAVTKVFTTGDFQQTENELDLAIEGIGFAQSPTDGSEILSNPQSPTDGSEILSNRKSLATIHFPISTDYSITNNCLFFHTKIGAAMSDKFIDFFKGSSIEKIQHSFASCHFTGFMLLFNSSFPTTKFCCLIHFIQPGNGFFVLRHPILLGSTKNIRYSKDAQRILFDYILIAFNNVNAEAGKKPWTLHTILQTNFYCQAQIRHKTAKRRGFCQTSLVPYP